MSAASTSGRYRPAELAAFCRQVFMKLGMPEPDAAIAAESLVRADMEGNEGHGVSRLPIYAKRMQEGRIASDPAIGFETAGAVLKVDGGNGLGQVVSRRALDKAVPLARAYGLAGVFIRRSNHFGTAAYFCQYAASQGMALVAMTNSPPGIPPWGGRKAFFGTNPIAFGFPVKSGPPVIVDMSSSVVARGKIILASQIGQPIPPGWAIDEEGRETTDPAAALRGAVLPVGGAKGYALALAVEIMCGLLTGAAYGPHVNNLYKDGDGEADVGHSFLLMDLSKWLDMDAYHARMDTFLREVKDVPRAAGVGEIFYPGERRQAKYEARSREGVDVPREVARELKRLGEELGVAFPKEGLAG